MKWFKDWWSNLNHNLLMKYEDSFRRFHWVTNNKFKFSKTALTNKKY